MKTFKNKHSVIVGIFISIALIILIIGVFTLGGQHDTFVKKISVKAVFDDVNGLKIGDNVWLSGVKVGVIQKIDFADNGAILITMNIERKVQRLIHKDSKVKIGSDGLIGNTIIVIYGGTKTSALVTNGDFLFSEKSAGTKDMLATLDESNKNLLIITKNLKDISNKILNGQGTLTTLLNDPDLPQKIVLSVSDLKSTMANFKTTSVQSKKVLKNLVDFSSRFNKEGTLVNDLVTDTIIFNNLRSSVFELNKTMNTISTFSDNIKKASDALNEKDNTAGVLLHDEEVASHLKSTINNLDSASHKLDEDLKAIQHNFLFRRYFKKKAKAGSR
jgi:phospholipid/cholesterol/gamma-HCH transport system substrate-binding protein